MYKHAQISNHLVDLVHHFFVLFHIQTVGLTQVMMQVVQQWRIIVVQCVVVPTHWIWVCIFAKISMDSYVVVKLSYIILARSL